MSTQSINLYGCLIKSYQTTTYPKDLVVYKELLGNNTTRDKMRDSLGGACLQCLDWERHRHL